METSQGEIEEQEAVFTAETVRSDENPANEPNLTEVERISRIPLPLLLAILRVQRTPYLRSEADSDLIKHKNRCEGCAFRPPGKHSPYKARMGCRAEPSVCCAEAEMPRTPMKHLLSIRFGKWAIETQTLAAATLALGMLSAVGSLMVVLVWGFSLGVPDFLSDWLKEKLSLA